MALDRRFVGLLPDVTAPLRRAARVRQLRAMIELNPADSVAQLELGSLLFQAGRTAEALPYLERAGKRLDDHATAQFYLGAANVRMGRPTEGVGALRRAVELRPEVQYGLPYVYLAECALKSASGGEGSATEAELQEWVSTVTHYGNVETSYRMGTVLMRGGRKEEAQRMFREALSDYRLSPPFARRAARRWALLARLRLRQLESR